MKSARPESIVCIRIYYQTYHACNRSSGLIPHDGLVVAVQHGFKIGERIERGGSAFTAAGGGIALMSFQLPLVFVVVAVNTQQFPVAAIHWIVAVIMVTVMNSQLMQIQAGKFAAATATNMRKQF